MKYSYLVFFMCALLTNGYSQSILSGGLKRTTSEGDALFQKQEYGMALNAYKLERKSSRQDPALDLKIANTYRLLDDYPMSESWYQKASAANALNTEAKLQYARVLAANKKYGEAQAMYESYLSENKDDEVAGKQLEGLREMRNFYFDSTVYEIKPLSFNTDKSEFASAFYDGGVILLATEDYIEDGNMNLDLYYAKIDAEGKFKAKPTKFSKELNSNYNEGPVAVTGNGSGLIITRNDVTKKKVAGKFKYKLKLFEAVRSGNEWGQPQLLPFSSDEYSVGHPTLSRDGKTLYFISDMPGGLGGTDIYKSIYQDSTWGAPQNMGPTINTKANEMFPFLHNDQYLFFASEGHPGLGGLDVFKTRIDKQNAEVINLGYPVNSSRDDFGVIVDPNWDYAYFSSNRQSSKGGDDIYFANIDKPKTVRVSGRLVDEEEKPVENALVQIKDNGKLVGEDTTNHDGQYAIDVPYGEKKYSMEMTGETIGTVTSELELDNSMFSIRPRIVKVENRLMYEAVVTNKDSKTRVNDAEITWQDVATGKEVKTKTDAEGKFRVPVELNKTYTLVMKKTKFFTFTKQLVINQESLRELGNFETEEIVIGKAIKLDNIYYDLGKATIRTDARPALDNLVKILSDNPEIKIELSSHTDAQGSDQSNMTLSQSRAQSVVDYVVSKGVKADRLIAKGYGETALLNKCGNGVKCSESQHQINRRTEFKVTTIN